MTIIYILIFLATILFFKKPAKIEQKTINQISKNIDLFKKNRNIISPEETLLFLHQLAALLKAGINIQEIWQHIYINNNPIIKELLQELQQASRNGREIAPILATNTPSQSYLNGLTHCFAIANKCGAPLATVLQRYARGVQLEIEAERILKTALQGPKTATNLLTLLPLLGIILGFLLGTNPIRTLLQTPNGNYLLIAGIILLTIGKIWTKKLVKQATT